MIMNELGAYADGRWAEFAGLDRCLLGQADAELGPRLLPRLAGGVFGGEPTLFTRYASAASDDGLTAWVLGELVVGLELHRPRPTAQALDDLDPPSAVISSELGPDWEQLLWPDRGLVLHQRGDVIAVALGLAPFTVEAWASDPLRRWRTERWADR